MHEEKAIIDDSQRNAPYAICLRYFNHYKRNLEEHLKKCEFSAESKQLFLEALKQENMIKFLGLVDCFSDDEFYQKLKKLKPGWDASEIAVSEKPTFHEWFITEKENSFSSCFFIQQYAAENRKVNAFFKLREHDARVLNLGN